MFANYKRYNTVKLLVAIVPADVKCYLTVWMEAFMTVVITEKSRCLNHVMPVDLTTALLYMTF
jgi:hypothetical protein